VVQILVSSRIYSPGKEDEGKSASPTRRSQPSTMPGGAILSPVAERDEGKICNP